MGRGYFTRMNAGGNPEDDLRLAGVSVYTANESGNPVPLLEDIELRLQPGEWLNIVGVNGSGKSTLARLLAGLYHQGLTGEIERGFTGEYASPFVLQRPESQLFGETPREEIQFALEWRAVPSAEIAPWAERTLAAVGLLPLADVRWERLSGGQRQLAAVAAASAWATPLIVFDEATSMLDDANRDKVLELAGDLHRQGTAVVWVTQRLDELRPETRTVAVAEGRIVYDGDTRTFFYGAAAQMTPCESCGLRLPYLAALALQLKRRGRLPEPLPLTEIEWREVWGNAERGAKGNPEQPADRAVR